MSAPVTCRKGSPTCYCLVGWPPAEQCPDCRDRWKPGEFRDSYCICPPVDRICPPPEDVCREETVVLTPEPDEPTEVQRLKKQLTKLLREHPTCRTYNCQQCAEKIERFEEIRRLEDGP